MARKPHRPTLPTGKARRSRASKRKTHRPVITEATAGAERDLDGCDLDFTQGPITEDAELPAARGGVETLRTPQRRSGKRR